jgi:hypothetical protein
MGEILKLEAAPTARDLHVTRGLFPAFTRWSTQRA